MEILKTRLNKRCMSKFAKLFRYLLFNLNIIQSQYYVTPILFSPDIIKPRYYSIILSLLITPIPYSLCPGPGRPAHAPPHVASRLPTAVVDCNDA